MLYVILHKMEITRIRQKETALIIAIILAFALFGLWLRLLPMEQLTSGPVPKVLFNDPWFSLRQIEVIAHNFPYYPWFDPMNGYPTGKEIEWGPLYPTLSAAVAILFGATNRPDIITVVSWIPPLFSLMMIPFLYIIGKTVADRRVGVISACLISVIAGEYLYRSFYGYLDHHFLEVILSTLFILLYLIILKKIHTEDISIPWKNKNLVIYSAFTGLAYYLGMMNMPTIVLFAGVIGVFCLIHAIISRDKDFLKNLTVAHTIIFGVFIFLFVLTGIHNEGFSLASYTPIHILLALSLIIEPLFFFIVVNLMSDKPRWQIAGVIIGIPSIFFMVASIILPSVTKQISNGFIYFFLFPYQATHIFEMQMWDITRAYHSFNITLIIMVMGIIISGYQIFKDYNMIRLCAIIWAIIILFSTVMHVRYEYYAAVIIVLYTSIGLSWIFDFLHGRLCSGITPLKQIRDKTKVVNPFGKKIIPLLIIISIISIITFLSAQMTWIVATKELKINSMDDDWADALIWLDQNSPQPGIDYMKIYEKNGFQYPETSYGVLSAWDYGHWITYLAKRIPITSPFQNNVPQVAQFLISSDEKSAENLATKTGTRYIIIDYEMLSSKFSSLPLWAIGPDAKNRYQMYYYQQSETVKGKYEPVLTLKPDFFNTMLARLYIFDGSLINSTGASLVKFSQMRIGEDIIPVITQTISLSPDEANKVSVEEGDPGTDLISTQYTHPIANIPALTHYRLIYESPTRIASDEYAQLNSVKIFERVEGDHIPGSGIIEIPLITNEGRPFVYRQNSTDGEFIVPYSTNRDGNGVKATGPYRNIITGETFEVSEEQILQGS